MTVTELIEHYEAHTEIFTGTTKGNYKNFAIELLELMRAKTEFGEPVRHTHEAIDKALEELRK